MGELKDLTAVEERHGDELLTAAAAGKKLTDGERSEALDWFLSDDPDPGELENATLKLNFGTEKQPRWVPWTIRPVGVDEMRAIRRRAASGNRQQRRAGGDVDEFKVNLEIVVAGTVDPDLRLAAQQKGVADPAFLLRQRFSRKPGYIAQIAGEILTLSGFDEDDVRLADAAGS